MPRRKTRGTSDLRFSAGFSNPCLKTFCVANVREGRFQQTGRKRKTMIEIKNQEALEKMRLSGKLASDVLVMIAPHVKPGVSTWDLDKLCHDFILDHKAIPAPLHYRGYPKSICTSVNEVICHGIPDKKQILNEGDIVNVDITVILHGYHGDTSCMFGVGEVSAKAQALMDATKKSLYAAIELVRPGTRLGDIGNAVQQVVEPLGYSVVRDFTGHGIGRKFHEDPQVLHYGRPGTGFACARA